MGLVHLLSSETIQRYLNLSNSTEIALIPQTGVKFNCVYSSLWCGSYSKTAGICETRCAPSIVYTRYDQQSCPPIENYFLAGFIQL